MILISDVIAQRDKRIRAHVRRSLLEREVPYAVVEESLQEGFNEALKEWEGDLKKYHGSLKKTLDEIKVGQMLLDEGQLRECLRAYKESLEGPVDLPPNEVMRRVREYAATLPARQADVEKIIRELFPNTYPNTQHNWSAIMVTTAMCPVEREKKPEEETEISWKPEVTEVAPPPVSKE